MDDHREAKILALIEQMKAIEAELSWDKETCHSRLDDALLDFIGDERVRETFDAIPKWYA